MKIELKRQGSLEIFQSSKVILSEHPQNAGDYRPLCWYCYDRLMISLLKYDIIFDPNIYRYETETKSYLLLSLLTFFSVTQQGIDTQSILSIFHRMRVNLQIAHSTEKMTLLLPQQNVC